MESISKNLLQRSLSEFVDKQVLIVGDSMIDKYVVGDVKRINPEAPVPVVEVQQERYVLGGAANVARNIQSLGGKPFLISVTGRDATATLLQERLDSAQIAHKLIAEEGRMTTIKTRVMACNQQIVRVDYETPHEIDNMTLMKVLSSIQEFLEFTDVIILSDYGKGIVTESFMNGLRDMMAHSAHTPKILVDPKVRNFPLYTNSFILTPNAKEALEGARMDEPTTGIDVLQTGDAIFDKLQCEHLLITLGARGMALFESPSTVYQIPTMGQKVFDVCGAGDTVISTLGLSLAAGHSLLTASILANYAAGIVVGEVGTACTTTEAIHDSIDQHLLPEIKILRA